MLEAFELLRAMNGINEDDIIMAENKYMNIRKSKGMSVKRIVTLALAATLILSLGLVANAAGVFAPIFNSIGRMNNVTRPGSGEVSPEFAEVMDEYFDQREEYVAVYADAEQYMSEAAPAAETAALPELNNSIITLSERYYDGENLMLGVNINDEVEDIELIRDPENSLVDSISYVAFFHDVFGNDDLDYMHSQGMEKETYDNYLNDRSENAREFDLRNISAISLDWHLKNVLSPEEYNEAWRILREEGKICIVEDSIYIGDHLQLSDGTDLGVSAQENMGDMDCVNNIFIECRELPDEALNRAELEIELKVRYSRMYYYMELGKPAYYKHEVLAEENVPFTVKNANRK